MQVFTDANNMVLDSMDALETRDKIPRVGFRKVSETSFTVFSFVVNGVPKLSYDIDINQIEHGVLHSLPVYNTIMNDIPEDRISMNIFANLLSITEMKSELGNLRMMYRPNNVLYFVVPKSKDVIVYIRTDAYFENIEPIIVNTNNVHEIIRSCYPLYEDPRELNTLRLKTVLALDPNDSLAYMESQLDFVTSIVLAMVESRADLKLEVLDKVREYANFKDAVERNMVFSVKDAARCLDEIRTNKAASRAVQRGYYQSRDALRVKKEANRGGNR